jgi:hypothetical protein
VSSSGADGLRTLRECRLLRVDRRCPFRHLRDMDLYHVWFDLKPGMRDTELVERAHAYLGHLQGAGKISRYRITRRKLGLAPPAFGEFHVMIEVDGLAQLDLAFQYVAVRSGAVEGLHAAVNQWVSNTSFALYRDFPDPMREQGSEQF